MGAFVWITHNPTLGWQSIRALNRREGGERKKKEKETDREKPVLLK